MSDKELLTIPDACRVLGISKPTLYSLHKRGYLPLQKKLIGSGIGGRRVFLLRADVENLKHAIITIKDPASRPVQRIHKKRK